MVCPMTQGSDNSQRSRLDEMKRYVGFSDADGELLQSLRPAAAKGLEAMLDHFYSTIARHPEASRVFGVAGGDIVRQRRNLAEWTLDCLTGPYDLAYIKRRKAIGQAHVRHQLPQRYMLLAMNLVRSWLVELAFEVHGSDLASTRGCVNAANRLLDIELALMLDTYRDDLMARMQRQERLATIGEMAAGIHHELKNPLAAVDVSLFALAERRSVRADPKASELLGRARANTDRASDIITDLLSFARLRSPAVKPSSVDSIVQAAVDRVTIPDHCRLSLDLDPALPEAVVDSPQIEQVLVNLLQNAFDACGPSGTVTVRTRLTDGRITISVSDDGTGIDSGHLERVFEPLFSTKPEGVGLGLSLSRNLVQANQGSIALASTLGQGTTVNIALPVT